MASSTGNARYIPWDWAITPIDPAQHVCPSASRIIWYYAGATFFTTVIALITSTLNFRRFVTRGRFGDKDSKSWMFKWIFQLSINLGADILVAYLTIHQPDYRSDLMPSVWQLGLFYTSRPRMAWLFIGSLWYLTPWRNAARQTLISEGIMQGLGTYYIVRALAAPQFFGGPPSARLMSAGALVTIVFTYLAILGLIIALHAMIKSDEKSPSLRKVAFGLGLGLLAFAGRWMFHVGYVRLAQDL